MKTKRKFFSFLSVVVACFSAITLTACSEQDLSNVRDIVNSYMQQSDAEQDSMVDTEDNFSSLSTDGNMQVHFIDVGQGDSCFIEFSDGTNMLIDAGIQSASSNVVSYVQELGYEKIDTVIATHPHADHIGGLPSVFDAFEVAQIYMPNATTNTKTFSNLLDAIENEGLTITVPEVGSIIKETESERVTVLSPQSDKEYTNLNDYSIILLVEHGNNSFLLTGDAEEESMYELLLWWEGMNIDVLKAAHHGSYNGIALDANGDSALLRAVTPSYAVISCGEGNEYGHPHDQTMTLLLKYNVEVLRTDTQGSITFISDGADLHCLTEK